MMSTFRYGPCPLKCQKEETAEEMHHELTLMGENLTDLSCHMTTIAESTREMAETQMITMVDRLSGDASASYIILSYDPAWWPTNNAENPEDINGVENDVSLNRGNRSPPSVTEAESCLADGTAVETAADKPPDEELDVKQLSTLPMSLMESAAYPSSPSSFVLDIPVYDNDTTEAIIYDPTFFCWEEVITTISSCVITGEVLEEQESRQSDDIADCLKRRPVVVLEYLDCSKIVDGTVRLSDLHLQPPFQTKRVGRKRKTSK